MWQRGENHAQHILTAAEAIEIREMARDGAWTLREIGEIFGVSKATVFDLKTQRTWRHLWDDATTGNGNRVAEE
jgi:hypothetical protein